MRDLPRPAARRGADLRRRGGVGHRRDRARRRVPRALSRARRPAVAARRRRPRRPDDRPRSWTVWPQGGVREVIIATNPSLEGEATALYVQRQLAPYRLARDADRAWTARGRRPGVRRRRDDRPGAVRPEGDVTMRRNRHAGSRPSGFFGGFAAGLVVWSTQMQRARRELFSTSPDAPLAALGYLARAAGRRNGAPPRGLRELGDAPRLPAPRPAILLAAQCMTHLGLDHEIACPSAPRAGRSPKMISARSRSRCSGSCTTATRAARSSSIAAGSSSRPSASSRTSIRRRSPRSPRRTSARTTSWRS